MTESHLVYKLEGNIKELDVFKLAPTLLALGNLIQESNRQLNPGGRDIGVNVKPFREGYFIVDIVLLSPSNLQHILEFLTPHSIEQLKTLLEVVGLVIGGSGVGVVQVIKFLKGKPKAVEEVKPGEFRYTSRDNQSITVSAPVHTLLSNSNVVQNVYNIYAPPMEDDLNVIDVKTYLEGQEQNAAIVKREELPILGDFVEPATILEESGETIKETLHHGVFLNPKRGAFGDDPKDWSFWRGEEIITATIKDKAFLAQHGSGEIRLNESDLLTVDLLERQRVKGTKVQRPIYEIIKVTDYKKAAEQPKLL